MKQTSFWEQKTFHQPYDLIIIGAGIVGVSSTLFYRRQHPEARILVLDKGNIPEGASTRNAGFACTGSITEHVADMEKVTEQNIKNRLSRRYRGLQLLRNTLGEESIGYDNCGGYEIFTTTEEFERARVHIDKFNDWMNELVGEEETYQVQTLNSYPAIYNRLEGALHPGKMMQSLLAKVQAAGITIRWNATVQTIGQEGTIWLKNGNELRAEQVLAASNGFTKRLLPQCDIQPARGYVMVSEPWTDIPWKGTFNYDRGYIYFRNVGNRLLLGGGRNEAVEEESVDQFGSNPVIKKYLRRFARETLQMPKEINFEHQWSGIMGFTPTKTPVIKRLDEHRVVAAGLSGMGIAIGMDVGKQAAGLLSNK
jgi:glycine/D-amino acid oxidase-like deaminating enzyme